MPSLAALALAKPTPYGPSRRPAAVCAVSGATRRRAAQRWKPSRPEEVTTSREMVSLIFPSCQERHAAQSATVFLFEWQPPQPA
jgi:hypothetical protein